MYGQRFKYFGARGPGGTLGLSVALGSLGCFLCRVRSEACAGTSAVLPYHQKTVGGQAGGVVGSAHASQCQSLSRTLWRHVHTTQPLGPRRGWARPSPSASHTHSHRTNWSLLLLALQSGVSATVTRRSTRAAPSPRHRSRAAPPAAGSARGHLLPRGQATHSPGQYRESLQR